jgi:4-aminobutyrate--pyruvate transaminase
VGNAVGGYCQKQCEEQGLILRALGGNSVAICPPLIITASRWMNWSTS